MSAKQNSLNTYLRKFSNAVMALTKVSGSIFVMGCASLAISRVCQLVAFFLPLKIFIIIHSEEVPSYFDIFPPSLDYTDTILLLCALVPLVYAAYISLGIAYRWLVDLHMQRLDKVELMIGGTKKTGNHLRKVHNHTAKAFSEVGLMAVSVVLAAILDPAVAIFWLILLYGNLWLFYRCAFYAEDHDRLTFLKLHRRQFIDYISSANFLFVFAALAVELVYFNMGVYTAIFLLLVSRMVFQALNRLSVESLYLIKLL